MTYREARDAVKEAVASGDENAVFAAYWVAVSQLENTDDRNRLDNLVINSGVLDNV